MLQMDYDEAIEWLYGTQLFGIKLGLEGTQRLFERLALFEALNGRLIFHVAGTNGKGSVCAMIDSISRATGKRSGLFTSPHLICFRERMRVDGSMIAESDVAKILSELRDEVIDWEVHPTFFELALALAVKYFCQQEVEVLVIETGMGGRLDASNVLPASVSVITSVDLDHQQWLGEDLESVAKEKAGIIKPGIPVITAASQHESVLEILQQRAGEQKSALHKVEEGALDSSLKGPHQRLNAALAVEAVKAAWPGILESTVKKGLAEVCWPGRFDRRFGNIVIDGAHNPAAVQALVATWKEEFGNGEKATVIFGAADCKEVYSMLAGLAAIAENFVFVKLSAKRGLEVEALAAALAGSGEKNVPWSEALTVSDALGQAAETGLPILVTGSLFLVGEVLANYEKSSPAFESSEQ